MLLVKPFSLCEFAYSPHVCMGFVQVAWFPGCGPNLCPMCALDRVQQTNVTTCCHIVFSHPYSLSLASLFGGTSCIAKKNLASDIAGPYF